MNYIKITDNSATYPIGLSWMKHKLLSSSVSNLDFDEIVTSSIGLRWAAGGPFLTFHLGGGKGGFPAFLKHLGPGMDSLWDNLGKPHLNEAMIQLLSELSISSYGETSVDNLEEERDQRQLSILRSLNKNTKMPS